MDYSKQQVLCIAIDGPAGAGKSTIAKLVAKQLELFYVDTGAMYRAIAYKALKCGVSIADELRVTQLAQTTEVILDHTDERIVWCDKENVTKIIRSPEITRAVSTVAAYVGVRERLVEWQRQEAERGGVVMDGRDIGTHVLPDADFKIFLTATLQERARRRWLELKIAGTDMTLEEVAQDIQQRDRQDSEREVCPLEPARDAVIIDTTSWSIEEMVAKIVALTQEERG